MAIFAIMFGDKISEVGILFYTLYPFQDQTMRKFALYITNNILNCTALNSEPNIEINLLFYIIGTSIIGYQKILVLTTLPLCGDPLTAARKIQYMPNQ